VDIFRGAFFMLSRYEELVVPARDRHGRFATASSIARAEGFLLPIVDAYVEVLWSALHQLWPRLKRRPRQFRIALSHDVDRPLASVGRSPPKRAAATGRTRSCALTPGSPPRRVRSWAGLRRGDHRLDPYNTFDLLMDGSERHATAGAFYFLATEEMTALDGLNTLEQPRIESLVRRIHERGHE
jgi:uncharacterized protein DUF7033